MGVVVLVIEILLCLFSVFIIAVVLLQSGKSAGISGAIAGGAESFLGKGKAKSYEGTLKKLTKIIAVSIMVLAVGLVFMQVYVLPSNTGGTTVPTASATATVSATPEPLQVPSSTPAESAAGAVTPVPSGTAASSAGVITTPSPTTAPAS